MKYASRKVIFYVVLAIGASALTVQASTSKASLSADQAASSTAHTAVDASVSRIAFLEKFQDSVLPQLNQSNQDILMPQIDSAVSETNDQSAEVPRARRAELASTSISLNLLQLKLSLLLTLYRPLAGLPASASSTAAVSRPATTNPGRDTLASEVLSLTSVKDARSVIKDIVSYLFSHKSI